MTKSHNVHLACGFQRRFDPTYVAVKSAIVSNRIGKPMLASVIFADHPCPPIEFLKTGGDIFMDLAPHDVDYVMWCMDDKVKDVYAVGASSTPELQACGVYDSATVLLRFEGGGVGTLSMSRSAAYGYDQRCEFHGALGSATVGNERENGAEVADKEGFHSARLKYSFPQRFRQGFEMEMDAFADLLREGKKWLVGREECREVQRVADAAKKSAKLGRPVLMSEV